MHPNQPIINDYVDNALGPAERAELERHLDVCAECRELVDDLRDLAARTAALEPMQPPARAWRRIERQIQSGALQPDAARPATASRYVWMAAAAAVLLMTAVGLRVVMRQSAPPTVATDNRELAQSIQSDLSLATEHYLKAIAGLEQIKNAEKGALDPQTAAALEQSFSVVDQAIDESRAALKAQPTSEPARESLLESFKTKIALLQDTVALINEMRKGNDAGAARIVSGLKQKS